MTNKMKGCIWFHYLLTEIQLCTLIFLELYKIKFDFFRVYKNNDKTMYQYFKDKYDKRKRKPQL